MLQAVWRGHCVRRGDGRAKREARLRLEKAAVAAQHSPHKHIGYRARQALELLLGSRALEQTFQAVRAIEFSTRYSPACCELIAGSGGVGALLRLARGCNRSKPNVKLLGQALQVLLNICR